MTERGFIRFVGGPKHNEHLFVEWRPWFSIAVPKKLPLRKKLTVAKAGLASPDLTFHRIDYELVSMRLGSILFCEYHLAGAKKDVSKDFAHCPLGKL